MTFGNIRNTITEEIDELKEVIVMLTKKLNKFVKEEEECNGDE